MLGLPPGAIVFQLSPLGTVLSAVSTCPSVPTGRRGLLGPNTYISPLAVRGEPEAGGTRLVGVPVTLVSALTVVMASACAYPVKRTTYEATGTSEPSPLLDRM